MSLLRQRARVLWHAFGAAVAVASLALAAGAAPAQEQKVLRVARTSQFDTLDPPRQFDGSSMDLVTLVYSGLMRYAYLERPYKVEPDLLAGMPELSADHLTYTLRLRNGVRFHDDACFPGGQGRELTADDVLYSLRRFADARINTKGWSVLEGKVAGLDAYRAATARPGSTDDALAKLPIEGLKQIDAHTLTIRLARPDPRFLNQLASMNMAIVPMEAVTAYGAQFGTHPVGTGPFMLKDVDRKGVLRFTRYPRYHGVYPSVGAAGDAERGLLKDAGRKLPLVDVLEMPLVEEAQPGMLRFLKGEFEWTRLDRANFSKMATRAKDGSFQLQAPHAERFRIHDTLTGDVSDVILNMKDPLLGSNKALRQALAYLVDTQAEIDVLRNGRGRKLHSLVPSEMPGNERETGAAYYSYDVARAKKLLVKAGFPGGKGLPVLTVHSADTTADGRNQIDLMRAKADAAGVQLKGQYADWPTTLKAVQSSNFQLALMGWSPGPPDAPGNFQMLHGKNLPPGTNFSSFVNADFDRAFEAARYLPDGPELLALLRTMNEIVREEVPVIIQYESISVALTQKWLRNFKRNPLTPEFMYLDVDVALQKKGLPP
ncbi:MAG TPA: ABC transporter substrate-binding protein [Rubrivivax sp.]